MMHPYATPQEQLADKARLLAVRLQPLLAAAPSNVLVSRPDLGLVEVDPEPLAAEITTRQRHASDLPLHCLSDLYGLSALEDDILLYLLATEVDDALLSACAYLHGDPARRWLTPGLLWQLLDLDPADPAARQPFDPAGPLLRRRLIHAPVQINNVPVPLLERPLKLDDRIGAYLLGYEALDEHLVGLVTLKNAAGTASSTNHSDGRDSSDEEFIPVAVRAQLAHLLSRWRQQSAPPVILWGRPGVGKQQGAMFLAEALCRPLLAVDATELSRRSWFWLRREADLRQALIYLANFDRLEEPAAWWARLGEGVILGADAVPPALLTPPPYVVQFPPPDHGQRHSWWRRSLNGQGTELDLTDLAGQFRLTPGQIQSAAQAAQQDAWLEEGPAAAPGRKHLFAGARGQSNPALSRLAIHVKTTYCWDDLVLPAAQLGQLRAIAAQARFGPQVYDQWGFGRKLPYGRGLAALFSGPSGTGKTMSASILGRALGLDLYKIDLAGVVSKYIGETEKNLDRIFGEARTANAILFFDEADALFGKRSEVKDAHDRYANIEISYLLQKMEEFDGVSILATNFSQNLDEAFARRMQFLVEFPLPDAANRERIWRGLIPPEAPMTADIDWFFLAQNFELTGGHIKNCVLAAAFAAAAEQEPISMVHLVRAVAAEFTKLGRPLQRATFGDYFGLARQHA